MNHADMLSRSAKAGFLPYASATLCYAIRDREPSTHVLYAQPDRLASLSLLVKTSSQWAGSGAIFLPYDYVETEFFFYCNQGWGQIRFIKYKYKYKCIFYGVSNTNANTPAKIWSNTNTNTTQQIQIQIHTEAKTKLPPFYRWHSNSSYCNFIYSNFTENCFQRSNLQ